MRSLTIITRLWSQRSTNVPAIGPSSRFGSVAARNTRPVAAGDPVRRQHHRSQRDLVQPVAEHADGLAEPEGAEPGIAHEPHVGMRPDPHADRWPWEHPRPRPSGRARLSGPAPAGPGPRPPPRTTGRPSIESSGPAGAASGRRGHARARCHPSSGCGVAPQQGHEHEPAQADGDRDIADADDVGQDRRRERHDVAERPCLEQERRGPGRPAAPRGRWVTGPRPTARRRAARAGRPASSRRSRPRPARSRARRP